MYTTGTAGTMYTAGSAETAETAGTADNTGTVYTAETAGTVPAPHISKYSEFVALNTKEFCEASRSDRGNGEMSGEL